METTTREENSNVSSYSSKSTPSWSSATNWMIDHGSLDNSVVFETSDSPIDVSDSVDSKLPLILKPPSPDSGPCEIKLTILQKHEIRQVYVRSTARVYEIYYAPALQASNEYLCTVHCSIAASEVELLHGTNTEEAVLAHRKGSNRELSENKFTGEYSVAVGANEDDWVEVKNPDSPLLDNGNSSMPRELMGNARHHQDLYEATAEISDADPCMTLTLRFLSLQNKGCVYVDEVYVYGDPVEGDDLGNLAVQSASSTGSSLMAMFVPTLLQMSRSSVGRLHDRHHSNIIDKQEHIEIESIYTNSTGSLDEIKQNEKTKLPDGKDVKLPEVSGVTAEVARFQIPAQAYNYERKNESVANGNLPYSQVDRVLEQLVSRVSRIEDICLRFEENLLKPINSMGERLQRVEDQLEVILKNSQNSGPSCTRFSAPAFSSLESNSSSFYNDDRLNPLCGPPKIEDHENPSNGISMSSDDIPKSVSAPQFLPSLVVTAPEFSCDEDDLENDVMEPTKDSPLENPKQALSIDNALAAALAGFSSMTSVESLKPSNSPIDTAPIVSSEENGKGVPLKYSRSPTVTARESTREESVNVEPSKCTQSLKVSAPDFTNVENGSDDKNGELFASSDSWTANGDLCRPDSVSPSVSASFVVCPTEPAKFHNVHVEETRQGDDGLDKFPKGQTDDSSLVAKDDLSKNDYQITEETSAPEASKVSVLNRFQILRQLLESQTEYDIYSTAKGVENDSNKDQHAKEFKSSYACKVDYGIPILEVEFAALENSSSKFPIEFLVNDMKIDNEVPTRNSGDDSLIIKDQSNSSSVHDEGERMILPNNDHRLVDLDNCDEQVSSSIVHGWLLDPHASTMQDMSPSLI